MNDPSLCFISAIWTRVGGREVLLIVTHPFPKQVSCNELFADEKGTLFVCRIRYVTLRVLGHDEQSYSATERRGSSCGRNVKSRISV